MTPIDEDAIAYGRNYALLEDARRRLREQSARLLDAVEQLTAGHHPSSGLSVLRSGSGGEGFLHWHLTWRAEIDCWGDESYRVLYVSCWLPGMFGSRFDRVGVATIACSDEASRPAARAAAIDTLTSVRVAELRELAGAPGAVPGPATEVTAVTRETLRVQEFELASVDAKTLAEAVIEHLAYGEAVVANIEEHDLTCWVNRRLGVVQERLDRDGPPGWHADTGRLGDESCCCGYWTGEEDLESEVYVTNEDGRLRALVALPSLWKRNKKAREEALLAVTSIGLDGDLDDDTIEVLVLSKAESEQLKEDGDALSLEREVESVVRRLTDVAGRLLEG